MSDIVKQLHFDRTNQLFHDYMMFIDASKYEIDNFVFIKLTKTVEENQTIDKVYNWDQQ